MSKLKDAVYGFAVGDALGVPYEFKKKGTFTCKTMVGGGTWGQLTGTWSDDTSMVLATCDSIKDLGRIDYEDIMRRFLSWYVDEKYTARGNLFDIGNTTRGALMRALTGYPVRFCGDPAITALGNGSLMRILPLAFTNCDRTTVHDVSALTHGHELAKICCWQYVCAARALLAGEEIPCYEEEVISTGYVVDTLHAAFHCLTTTDNYKDCVLKAVNLGGDTDTVAALAGGLAGIKYGYDAIPKAWIKQLANKKLIDDCLF